MLLGNNGTATIIIPCVIICISMSLGTDVIINAAQRGHCLTQLAIRLVPIV